VIPVARPDEPKQFDGEVRRPGRVWLEKKREGRPPDYWRRAQPALQAGFLSRCGYSAMLDRSGTVDHFIAQDLDPELLYEWHNLRYASQWLNSSKQAAEGVLDPYEVGEGWFEVELPSLQLVATDRVPPDKRELVEATLQRLPIRDDERVIRQRRAWLDAYERKLVTLDGLREFAPLIAAAVEKREQEARPKRARAKPKARPKRARAKPKAKEPKATKPHKPARRR
jgi:hypothetical protein